ncbi:hypothetical protein BDW67DRAFT_178687 [Aspergillus spinulosporus]
MSFDFLTSSYLQYKADTDAVANWLVATAKTCGFPVDTLGTTADRSDSAATQSSKRLKGKARKLAREAARIPASTQTANLTKAKPKNVIALKDFIALSDYIAASTNPVVSVPATKRSSGAFLQKPSIQHNYFIGILEHVWQVLKPRMPSYSTKDSLTQSPEDDSGETQDGNLANRFGALDVQEPSEAFLKAPDAILPLPRDDKAEPDVFAFCLLLRDLQKMQAVIKHTWEGYRLGKFDLVAASLMTNSAIGFVRNMEEEIQPLLDAHGGAMTILFRAYATMCLLKGEDPEARQQFGDPVNFRTYDIAESIFLPTFILIDSFCDNVDKHDKSQILPYKAGYFGTFDRASNRSKKSGRGRFDEDKLVMLEILSEFLFLHRLVPSPEPHEDDITRGLRQMFDTHRKPLWLTFGCQVFLDIHHSLRDDVERGFRDATMSSKVIENSIKLNKELHSKLRIKNWPNANDTAIEILLKDISSWWHPLLCGTWTYNLKARYQDLAIRFQAAWGSIMYSAHLYNALRQEKLMSRQWVDLDFVLSWHKEIFVGEPPQNPEDYLKQFELGVGYSAALFAKSRRQTGTLPASKTGPKSIQPTAPVSRMFIDRYVHGSGQDRFSESDMKRILARGVWKNNDEDQEGGASISMKRSATSEKRIPGDNGSLSRRSNIIRLLEALRNTLQAEALEFSFDYLAVHRSCWEMLREVSKACGPPLRSIHGPEYIESESQLPFIVGYILMAATEVDRLGKALANEDKAVKMR